MRSLYQPLAALLAAGVCAACGGEAPTSVPPPPPRSWPLAVSLASRSFAPVGVEADGALVAAEIGPDAVRALRLRPGASPEPILAGAAEQIRPLALLAGGGLLAELADGRGGAPRLALLEGARSRAFGEPGERLLGVARDGRTVWTAFAAPAGESWIETAVPTLARRTLLAAPPGFAFAAISPSGRRAAARRALHDEADEVILLDRSTGERRLLLPTGRDGRFAPQLFDAAERRLLLAADDASDLPRLEWLDLTTSARELALDSPCGALGARLDDDLLVAELVCAGRRELAVAAPEGERLVADWRARLPADLRAVVALPGPDGDWWLATAGPAAARDLLRLPARGVPVPATWGLAARLDPAVLPRPSGATLRTDGAELPVEIWPATSSPRGGLVWLESDRRPPAWGEFEPFLSHLAAHGVTVLRLRARGSDGFGRALRSAGDRDPWRAALADIGAAAGRLAAQAGLAGRPLALVGDGELAAAAAVAAAARERSPFAAVAALDPAADPLAVVDTISGAAEPARSRLVARWGDPADPRTLELRRAAAGAAAEARVPLLVVLDAAAADATARRDTLAAAAAGGRPVRAIVRQRPLLAPGAGRAALEETWRFLDAALAGAR